MSEAERNKDRLDRCVMRLNTNDSVVRNRAFWTWFENAGLQSIEAALANENNIIVALEVAFCAGMKAAYDDEKELTHNAQS